MRLDLELGCFAQERSCFEGLTGSLCCSKLELASATWLQEAKTELLEVLVGESIVVNMLAKKQDA